MNTPSAEREREPAAVDDLDEVGARRTPRSTSRNAPNSATLAARLQFHSRRATTKVRIVVIAIVPVTAMPYAAARFVDEPKPSTSATTPTNSIQLMPGT